MLRITAVGMTAVPYPGKNCLPFEHWLGESFRVEVALPRKTFSISVLDDMRLRHSAVLTANARLSVGKLDAPNMTATITYRFILFHPFILVRLD